MVSEILKSYKKIYPISINMEGGGFGSVILITINQIRYCERNNLYPVVAYDSRCKNAYHDASLGNEMWSQYFESIKEFGYDHFQEASKKGRLEGHLHRLSSAEAIKVSEEHPDSVYSFPFGKWRSADLGDLDEWYALQRAKGRETVQKYIRPKAHILKKADDFYNRYCGHSFVLGLHVRGTDLHYAPVVSPAEYFPHVDQWIEKQPGLKILLATDQAQYIPVFEARYGERVVYSDSFRSDNEVAPFLRKELSAYKKGEEVLLDILLLSGANFLIKGSSNVGEMALYFNPDLECLDLGYKKQKAFGQSYDKDWDNHTNPPAWKLVNQRGLDTLAADAAAQNAAQRAVYELRKKLKVIRVKGGIVKRKLKTLIKNPHFIFHWMYNPIDRLLALWAIQKNTRIYRAEGRLFGPLRMDHLPQELQNCFNQDFRLLRPRLIKDRRVHKSIITDSIDQVPDLCKMYMSYKNGAYIKHWPIKMIEEMTRRALALEDFSCQEYPHSVPQFYRAFEQLDFKDSALVLGSISPWIESILLAQGIKQVTTIEYDKTECEHPDLKTISRLFDDLPASESFDLVCSFSSIEHSGLGRYGDEIDPYGDLKAMKEINQWLAPGGIALIGVPVSDQNLLNSFGNKFYSRKFLEEKLFKGFKILNSIPYPIHAEQVNYEGFDWQNQPLFILKKPSNDRPKETAKKGNSTFRVHEPE